ncbi:MAG: hypothetical protein HY898_04175 [Deltaproteobacteria bacterium]|nr:hypothetical protein [Deltaproteobacteria bacterium]
MKNLLRLLAPALLVLAGYGCGDNGDATLAVETDGGGGSSDGGGGKAGSQDGGGGKAGSSGDGGSQICLDWYGYMGQHCTDAALDVATICAKVASLGAASGCTSQYDALYACIDANRPQWSCGLSACSSQAKAVSNCVTPYCTQHPNDCETPF